MAYPTFEPAKHPRGYAGRFAGSFGATPVAHSFRGAGRPKPPAMKRMHAITPIRSGRFAGIAIKGTRSISSGSGGD